MKKISLSKKEEELIRSWIAIDLSSQANTLDYAYPDVQNNLWDNNCFLFDKKYFKDSPNWFVEQLKSMKNIFDKLNGAKDE